MSSQAQVAAPFAVFVPTTKTVFVVRIVVFLTTVPVLVTVGVGNLTTLVLLTNTVLVGNVTVTLTVLSFTTENTFVTVAGMIVLVFWIVASVEMVVIGVGRTSVVVSVLKDVRVVMYV